uniref:Putative aquaporin NIP7-1 n=1 Tax=Anthurium amnicola TaxID=1678845 RepID=A0A1D1XKE0_9ARAE
MDGLFGKLSRKISETRSSSSASEGDRENGAESLEQREPAASLLPPQDRRHLILLRMVLAEMIGTFILVFSVWGVGACSILGKGQLGLMEYASTGCTALILIAIVIGPISGAHINPSITVAFAAIGRFPWQKVPYYVSAQMLGSLSASYVGKLVYNMPPDFLATRPMNGRISAFWAELFATMFIMLIGSAVSFNAEAIGQLASFAIGAAIALAILITGPVSGGSMNPARSFGPAVVAWKFDDLWLYFVAPTAGALAGAFLYKLIYFPLCQHRSSTSVSNASEQTMASLPSHLPSNNSS